MSNYSLIFKDKPSETEEFDYTGGWNGFKKFIDEKVSKYKKSDIVNFLFEDKTYFFYYLSFVAYDEEKEDLEFDHFWFIRTWVIFSISFFILLVNFILNLIDL